MPHFNDSHPDGLNAGTLADTYRDVRAATDALAGRLSIEDMMLQSMPQASPVKWHLGHTSWFFETFILAEHKPGYRSLNPQWKVLFNSYYNGVGRQHPRPQRGLLSRPSTDEVMAYRHRIDEHMLALIESPEGMRLAPLIVLGLNHEQQHQELILTDLKHALSHNPLAPAITELPPENHTAPPTKWLDITGGIVEIGAQDDRFAFDNELPRHRVLLENFQLASRPVSNGEFADFMTDGGYTRPLLWLSDGWAWRERENTTCPLYWQRIGGAWHQYTLGGIRPVDPGEPVCHISFYEAAAYAAWAGARLPTEFEWEQVAGALEPAGHFADSGRFHPCAMTATGLTQLYGNIWEWTASSYGPYPGYAPAAGAVGEYNGKFMANQMVLRGGSCATPAGHVRASYRNFFYPHDRWQFSGIRLAQNP